MTLMSTWFRFVSGHIAWLVGEGVGPLGAAVISVYLGR
jgi:hypothetical protein